MASPTEDAESAADRLEAALERIARMARPGAAGEVRNLAGIEGPELRDRLDRIIGRLRSALDGHDQAVG